jgi:hypothetical protein
MALALSPYVRELAPATACASSHDHGLPYATTIRGGVSIALTHPKGHIFDDKIRRVCELAYTCVSGEGASAAARPTPEDAAERRSTAMRDGATPHAVLC